MDQMSVIVLIACIGAIGGSLCFIGLLIMLWPTDSDW